MGLMRERERLKGFLTYMLGRNPYEFGLVPDDEGYVKKKDLIKVMQEEKGWGHVRQQSLDELIIALPEPGIEADELRIRASDRDKLVKPVVCDTVPRLLFVGIRNKAHGHVLENGIHPFDDGAHVVLSPDRSMAERIARRKDHRLVMVTVNTRDAENLGVLFLSAGDTLYLAREIPLKCFTAPPLEISDEERTKAGKKKPDQRKSAPMAGSFIPDFSGKRDKNDKVAREDKLSWKHNKKQIRRQKDRFTDDF
jgi:putative RNA 2'-phosphotransferase